MPVCEIGHWIEDRGKYIFSLSSKKSCEGGKMVIFMVKMLFL
jgi:hypothetical protein